MNQYYFFTKEYIYSQVSQETIFEFYFGEKINLGNRYCSPLRKDDSPGCNFYYGDSGDLLFYDTRLGSMDCIAFIMKKFNVNYFNALVKIKCDLISIKNVQTETLQKEQKAYYLKKIEIKRRKFSEEELGFWQLPDFEVTEKDLESDDIFAVSDVWYNGQHKLSNLKFCFAYKQTQPYFYQIYRPFVDKSLKFRTNDGGFIYGFEDLDFSKDYVILNKSKKDNFFAKYLGYNSLGIISESLNLDPNIMKFLFKKFKKVYICYDNDEAGKKAVEKFVQIYPELIPYFPLDGKDFTDMAKSKGGIWVQKNFVL